MEADFKTIGVLGRMGSISIADTLNALCEFLESVDRRIVVETGTVEALDVSVECEIATLEEIGSKVDLVIVVGGDGSMLRAARSLCVQDVPVLGINRGSLGFLTDIHPDAIQILVQEVLNGEYRVEQRFLLEMNLVRMGSVLERTLAMNEVVLHRGSSLRMIEFELFIDGQFVYSQHSDGLIVSSPTGSTAYSLSGGGSILHPSLNAISLLPMFPHSLTSRPLIVGGDSEIRIVIGNYAGGNPEISCDGYHNAEVTSGDIIYIQKKPELLTLIHPENHDFFETCRSKLGWGRRLA